MNKTLDEFKVDVAAAFPYGIEYANDVKYTYEMFQDEPRATLLIDFGCGHEYKLDLIVGEDGAVGIACRGGDCSTIELSQESVFAFCLFESHEEIKRLRKLPRG